MDPRKRAMVECGRNCTCDGHAHHLKQDAERDPSRMHICSQRHPCPMKCNAKGLCPVSVKQRSIEQGTFVFGAEVKSEKRMCSRWIPVGKFKHDDEDVHQCHEHSDV